VRVAAPRTLAELQSAITLTIRLVVAFSPGVSAAVTVISYFDVFDPSIDFSSATVISPFDSSTAKSSECMPVRKKQIRCYNNVEYLSYKLICFYIFFSYAICCRLITSFYNIIFEQKSLIWFIMSTHRLGKGKHT